jgi:hypothetical protein
MTKETLLMEAANLVLLGPWHFPLTGLWHGSAPSPTVKKKCRSTSSHREVALVVECSVDEPQHVRLSWLHLELERV